jgi:RHS repeat-associated protein
MHSVGGIGKDLVGKESDTETGLYYYRARYYDPTTSHFQSEDPIGFRGGANFYAYVHNDPTVFIDPKGLLQVCCRSAHLFIVQAGAWLTGHESPCHCLLRLSNGDTLGGYFSYRHPGQLITGLNDNTDHDKYAKEAKCSDIPGSSCDNDARAKKAFDGLPQLLGTYGFGNGDAGTSNRVAASILSGAGFSWQLPSCAWGNQVPPPHGGEPPFPGAPIIFHP